MLIKQLGEKNNQPTKKSTATKTLYIFSKHQSWNPTTLKKRKKEMRMREHEYLHASPTSLYVADSLRLP